MEKRTNSLITGGCGFIGVNLVQSMFRNNPEANIRILDNLSVGQKEDLSEVCDFSEVSFEEVKGPPNDIELIIGDVKNFETCYRACKGIDIVVHLAANTGVLPSVENPRADMEANVIGTFNMLEASRQNKIQKFIFDRFKEKYGEEKDAYFDKGVTDKKMKTRAYDTSLDVESEDRLPLENYLTFLDYKKIVENKIHWPLFKPVFDIPELGEKGFAKNIRWMERINELRRIPAHPTESRHFKAIDFDYIVYIYDEFISRLDAFLIETLPEDTE